jgi:hypothetical protein
LQLRVHRFATFNLILLAAKVLRDFCYHFFVPPLQRLIALSIIRDHSLNMQNYVYSVENMT